jgi:hypothetical protein
MTKAEFHAALDARKPDFDRLIAKEGVLGARRYLYGYISKQATAARMNVDTATAEFSEWWDRHYSQVN